MKKKIRRGTNYRTLSSADYRTLIEHLKEGWSFWSVLPKLEIGIYSLTRLTKEDPIVIEIRNRYERKKNVKLQTSNPG